MTITGLAIVVALVAITLLVGVVLGARLVTASHQPDRRPQRPVHQREIFETVKLAHEILAELGSYLEPDARHGQRRRSKARKAPKRKR